MGRGRGAGRAGTRAATSALVLGAAATAAAVLAPPPYRGLVVLAVLLVAGPLVALAVHRLAPGRRRQWLLVAAAGTALAVAWAATLAGLPAVAVPAHGLVYVCLGVSAHLAMAHERRRRWVLAVDVVAVACVGAAAALWAGSVLPAPPPWWSSLLLAGDLALLAYLVALLHSRARVTFSVAALGTALLALVAHHAGAWLLGGAAVRTGTALDAALVVTAVMAVAAAWHPSMRVFGDVVSPLLAPRRQVLVVVPAVLGLPAAMLLATLGLVPPPGTAVRPVVAAAALLAVALMATSSSLSALLDRRVLETDPLTRVGNRRALERVLAAQIHQGSAPVRLVVVELEEVDVLARRQGRQAADELLVRRVSALVEGLPDAVVCRTGPQTVAVVVPTRSRRRRDGTPLGVVAEVRALLPGTPEDGGDLLTPATAVLTVPARGEVAGGDDGPDGPGPRGTAPGLTTGRIVDALLRHAELSLLVAHDRGVPVEADVTRDGAYERARRLDLDLAAALAGGEEIVVHYQPLVEPCSGAVRSLEALVRWRHPDLGSVPPDDFLEAAALQGRSRELDDLTRRRALADFRAWDDAGVGPDHVAVNLSAESLQGDDLVERVLDDLATAGVDPHRLVLEVVEQERLRDLAGVAARLRRLVDVGVGVAVDDFGVGHAALQYLLLLPVGTVKVDRSLVAQVGTPRGRALLGAVVGMATSLGATAVAEGVESREQQEAVAALGFGLAQGFACGRPAPAEATTALLTAHARGAAAPGATR